MQTLTEHGLNLECWAVNSGMDDTDWLDFIDIYTGVFTYFGDNKRPGFDLHDTRGKDHAAALSWDSIMQKARNDKFTGVD